MSKTLEIVREIRQRVCCSSVYTRDTQYIERYLEKISPRTIEYRIIQCLMFVYKICVCICICIYYIPMGKAPNAGSREQIARYEILFMTLMKTLNACDTRILAGVQCNILSSYKSERPRGEKNTVNII